MYMSKDERRIHKRVKEKKYKLHSKGENWWHFRTDQKSIMESFTVSRVHDGTIILTGDMGCLAHRRTYFKEDTPFPCNGTSLNYFLGKVYHEFECYIFDPEEAIKDLKKDLKETYFEGCNTRLLGKINDVIESTRPTHNTIVEVEEELTEKQAEVLEFLSDLNSDMDESGFYHQLGEFSSKTGWDPDWYERDYGKKVDPNIIYKFELLKVWGDYMWKQIEKEKKKKERDDKRGVKSG